ncbi:complement factor H isoform X3 [Pogoniulus pusillus]|uniref:complement factor H isoform X3 n=1 Tax=Pogoniulus pusillus TaxID=488313 RepID=UPI0030B94BC3
MLGCLRSCCPLKKEAFSVPLDGCAKDKPCGHPGDIEFGSFQLTNGSEFVFGARVEYRCDDGYWMLSQKNYRECLADGWSNDVPHCEVAKCLPLEAPENGRIITAGAFELNREYSFGQVVNFECNAEYKLVGNKELICSSNGKWSSDVPQCQDVLCNAPEIPNGYLRSPKQTYKKFEKLQFACNEGYKQGERADVRCTESGWNPTPHCVEKKCEYLLIENGRLDMPVKNRPKTVGQNVYYYCSSGYVTSSGNSWEQLVCSVDGWSPVPKCFKQCQVTYIPNGKFTPSQHVYKEGESITYVCDAGYSAAYAKREVICTKNDWSPQPKCIRKRGCQKTNIGNGDFIGSKRTANLQEMATYRCHAGFVTPEGKETGATRCQENGWSPRPECIKACKAPSWDILNYPANKTMFVPGDTIQYACSDGFVTEHKMPTGTSRCGIKGEWNPKPQCLEIKCETPPFTDGDVSPWWNNYDNGHVVTFTCRSNYKRLGPAFSQCYYFGWFPRPPLCKENPKDCGPPPEIANGTVTKDVVGRYQHGDRMQYECGIEFKLVGPKEIECIDGQWSSPPSCIEVKTPCGSPSSIPNVRCQQKQPPFSHGDEVICTCKQSPLNSAAKKLRCLNGEWKPFLHCPDPQPQCARPKDVEIMGENYSSNQRTRMPAVIQYRCPSAESTKLATCVSGKWLPEIECADLFSAETTMCPPPPQVPDAQEITTGRNYKNGSKISFSCREGFQLIGASEITCIEGKWQSPPYCVARSCVPPKPPECAAVPSLETPHLKITTKNGETIYLSGARLKYVPRPGYKLNGTQVITCSAGNWTPAPACLELPCGSIPRVANAQPEGRHKESYEPGETIHYHCGAGFQIIGSPEIFCREGNWTEPPSCEDNSCGAAPEIPHAYITSTHQERYRPGARVQYECGSDFQMMGENYIVCTNGEWSNPPTCTDMTCGSPPEIAGGRVQGAKKARYLPGETARYQCWQGAEMTGAATVACDNGTWTELPKCKGIKGKCGPPPVIENGDILSFPRKEYPDGATLTYRCLHLYVMEGSETITCNNGQWMNPPVCLAACTASEEDMNTNNIELKWVFLRKLYTLSGDFMEFQCKIGYMEDPASSPFRAQCVQGTIQYPRCKPTNMTCGPPPEIAGGRVQGAKKARYLPGETARYQCWQGAEMTGAATVACDNGTWTELPKCKGIKGKCGPPPVIENGDILSFPKKEYPDGATLTYKCPHLYLMEGSETITCNNGQWMNPPVCLAACTASEEDMNTNNIELKWVFLRKLYTLSGDFMEFQCKIGYMEDPASSPFRAQCVQGTIQYPRCKPTNMTCGPPPEIAGGRVQGTKKARYLPGETARYQCWQGAEMTGAATVACDNGTWTELPKCKEACTASEEDMNTNNIELRWSRRKRLYSKLGDVIEFQCKRGYTEDPESSPFQVRCVQGTLQYPRCKPAKDCTVDPSIMARNHIKLGYWAKSTYHHGETIEFHCTWRKQQVSYPEQFNAVCKNGAVTYPVCASACTASEEDMNTNNIELRWSHSKKLYSKSGDVIEFQCKGGYTEDPESSPFRVLCVQGTIEYPRCKLPMACTATEEDMNTNNIELRWILRKKELHPASGDFIEFQCKWGYKKDPASSPFRAQCVQGRIEYPRCKPTKFWSLISRRVS